jgi:riboflavin kinase/FMN adenylyltransferase
MSAFSAVARSMELIRGHHNLRPRHRGCVATIGNFDGVHLGHRAVLRRLIERSAELGLPSTLITFEPYPQEFFSPSRKSPRLTSLREKIEILKGYPIDRVLCLHFNHALAEMSAEDFIRRILVESLGVRLLAVGGDFRFGHRRTGDIDTLREAGPRFGFEVAVMAAIEIDGVRVSSTRIRDALQRGDLRTAERLLGRRYWLGGRVVAGDGRGHDIGFPTANVDLQRRSFAGGPAPVAGVFAVEVYGIDPVPLKGVANVGVRPTIGGVQSVLEVHLLDFNGNLYGRRIRVEFLMRLREERRFDSLEALRLQIAKDVEQARAWFAWSTQPDGGVAMIRQTS